jgi:DNA-binding protein HU-beta
VIKLDIINQVVERTGISRTKAEMAVDSVFEAMKAALPLTHPAIDQP